MHWRRSALKSAGALQVRGREFRGIFTPFYTINFRGLCKTGGARAPAAPPSSAPMIIRYSEQKGSDELVVVSRFECTYYYVDIVISSFSRFIMELI